MQKASRIGHKTIESWVRELAKSVQIRATGSEDLDDKWFTTYMAKFTEPLVALQKQAARHGRYRTFTKGLTYDT